MQCACAAYREVQPESLNEPEWKEENAVVVNKEKKIKIDEGKKTEKTEKITKNTKREAIYGQLHWTINSILYGSCIVYRKITSFASFLITQYSSVFTMPNPDHFIHLNSLKKVHLLSIYPCSILGYC